jgi:hypothetical protein
MNVNRLTLLSIVTIAHLAIAKPATISATAGSTRTSRVSTGLSAEVLTGVMLFDASRGGLDPRFLAGARLSWQLPQGEEVWRRIFFVDVTYWWSATEDGTAAASVVANRHFISAAPAIAYPLPTLPVQFYAQAGAGVLVTAQTIRAATETNLSSTSFLFQYGGGVRVQPDLGKIAGSFRFEVTRFIRNGVHDTFIGATAGLAF